LNVSDKTISILFVIDGLEFGGGERVFLQLASGLKDRYEIFVATDTTGRFAFELDRMGIELSFVNMSRQLSLKPIRQIKKIIQSNEIDLVHSQGARADFFARIAGKIADAPHILCTIAMPVEGFEVGPLRKTVYRFMDRLSERYVEKFIAVSESLRNVLIEGRGIAPHRVVKIYNGIELDKYHPDFKETSFRSDWGIPPEATIVGAIGRMVWQKGFKFLIKAISDIVEVAPDTRFLLVGDGPLRPDLENLARKLDVYDRVIFTGFRSDIPDLLSTMDVLVVPSLLEGFPMITLEAMAMAKPIVAAQIQGIIEQISDGEEGVLVPSKNSNALAAAVLRFIQNRELASRLGAAARRKVESTFSTEKMVRETEKVYLSLLRADRNEQLSLLR
jgi:glycosyltransferase involved in cell wall biosynthesis